MEKIKEYFSFIVDILKELVHGFRVYDVFDVLFVTVILFYALRFIRNRRAGKLAAGIFILIGVWLLSRVFSFYLLDFILNNIFQVGIIALIIIFQPEIRALLEKVGGVEPLRGLNIIGDKSSGEAGRKTMNEICDAAVEMAKEKTGALIVIERKTKLGEYIKSKSGTEVDAEVASFLLRNIFFKNAPLHDGAVIIRGGRIAVAGCYLPLSTNDNIIKDLGTRHRAGIGISEVSDAVVVIVSEETGAISVACDGKLYRWLDRASLYQMLDEYVVKEFASRVRKGEAAADSGENGNANVADGEQNK